jgi:phage-related protein (TIGR01555 family)
MSETDPKAPRRSRTAPKAAKTFDSFQNFAARIGLGTDNLQSGATYGFNPISRVRQLLEWMYGGSWIVGKTVDCVADDMTRAGVTINTKGDPDEVEELTQAMNDLGIWPKVNEAIKWSRLYGGAIAVMLIDGQRMDKPLQLKSIGKDQFKGLAVLDRWMINPTLSFPITALGPELGDPTFYDVVVDNGPLGRQRIHHSRVIRLEGLPQPYWRKISENGWGISVIEPLYDRLVAYDSTTNGAAQLVHKAHLRILKVAKLREIIAAGGKAMEGLSKQVDMIRLFQTNEGLTLLDATDEFETQSYTFAGLDSVLQQFDRQLAGAADVPQERLFGDSPGGLGDSGEGPLRNYYDGIKQRQERQLRRGVTTLLHVLHASVLGKPTEDGFNFAFTPLWQMSETDKADVAQKTTSAITGAFDSGITGRGSALKDLRAASQITGVFGNITDEEIDEAEEEPPPTAAGFGEEGDGEGDGGNPGENPFAPKDEPDPKAKAKDHVANFALHGLGIVIETPKGALREGPGWSATMAAHYGYIAGTWSAEGAKEEMDCFIGPNPASQRVWVVDQKNLTTGAFHEHKCMLGYDSEADAVRDYIASYHDAGFARITGVTEMALDQFKAWLAKGRLDKPAAGQRRAA